MKTTIFVAIAIAISTHVNAQYRFWGLVGSNVQGVNIGGNSVVIGTSGSTATGNVIIGNNTGNANTGGGNVFIGEGTATVNTTGYANAFFGTWSGSSNTTGIANTFLGHWSGPANTTGAHNVFVGQGAGRVSTTGGDNSFMGQGAGWDNVQGYLNTFMGKAAGVGNISGYNNSVLGSNAGFYASALTNATAIGANAKCGVSNALILGPDGVSGTRVNVGIGTSSPGAHLHTVTNGFESVIFSTTSATSSSNLSMRAGYNNVNLFVYGNTASGTYLPAVGAAPAVPNAAMAGLVTGAGEPLTIGVDGYEHSGSIYFNNMVANSSGSIGRTECMRIDNPTGFVGIHTRQTGNGRPQALLHVNLTNPVNSNLNPLTQGIRFQGLPAAQHPDVIVVDANGNLARRAYPTGGGGAETDPLSWHLAGNAINPGEFIGTTNNLDFVVKTNNLQRARVTNDGNLDFGGNSISSSTTSAAVGTNTVNAATSSIATGNGNTIDHSDYSAAFGDGNTVHAGSTASQATGVNNEIDDGVYSLVAGNDNYLQATEGVFAAGQGHDITNSFSVAATGGRNEIKNSNESTVSGEDNKLYNAHGSFIGGGHNTVDGSYDFVGGRHNTVMGNFNFVGGDQNQANGSFNFALGFHLVADNSSFTPVSPNPTDPNSYLMVIGERINSNLNRSLSVGFNGNRTTVTTERGMSVQIDPASGSTDIPVANFEVEAGVGTTGRQPLSGAGLQSNVRFHNLPPDPQGRSLPAVLIDPGTGELFLSQNSYMKPGRGGSEASMDSLYNENTVLKERVEELESQVSAFNEKLAQLERSINHICESGCAGLNNSGQDGDVLYQSVPNPTDNNARINYRLARNYSEASISLFGTDGRELHTYKLNPGIGDGAINISLGELQPGMYLYTLVVDGRQVDVKKLQKQ